MITITVNGKPHQLDIDPVTPLLYVLRNDLELNGAKFGCGLGQCGACTVIVDGEAVFSCLMPVVTVQGRAVETIEGLGSEQSPGPLQRAFIEEQAAQCGYCIAGMIMRAQALLARNSSPSDKETRAQREPIRGRCGTNRRIRCAIRRAGVAI